MTCTFEATDPRDRLYALLGMIQPDPDPIFVPDYCTPLRKLYKSWAVYILATDRPFQALAFTSLSKSLSNQDSELPSWVYNRDNPLMCSALSTDLIYNTLVEHLKSLWLSEDRKVLNACGIKLGEITNVLEIVTPRLGQSAIDNYSSMSDDTMFKSTIVRLMKFIEDSELMSQKTLVPEVYSFWSLCQTIMCGHTDEPKVLSAEDLTRIEVSIDALKALKRETLANMQQESSEYYHELLQHTWFFLKSLCAYGSNRVFGTIEDQYIGMFPCNT
jgi:hypothetical protein